ncbi:hypothetical protein B9Z55_023780 [Caenorhabditis nigoni]|nr:hypothetical protein B9Z55_023780 [Caenorhabditis nigoni]
MFEGISTQNTKKPEAVEVISYEYDKIKRAHINALSKYISPHHGTSLNNFSLYDIIYDAAEMIAPGTTDSILRELLQSLERFSISDLVQFSIEIQAIEKQVEDFLSELVLFQKQQQEENATVREMTEEMMKIDMKERAKLNDDMQTAIDSTETLKDLCVRQEISLMGKWNAAKRTLLYDFTPKINQLLENLKTAARVDEHIPPHEMRRPVQRKFANEVISQKVDTFRLKLLEFLKSEAFNQLG